ncbi:MAG: hypothetical protein HKN08_09465 [Gammaproteobacteria bacterium]|nr:hypothetical protein [Gammaproteobacteria bacterium]
MINSSKSKKFLPICITLMVVFNVYAYDGDVDYTAPYVTIDPETGTLVTVDPKTQTKTPHASSGNTESSVNASTENTTTTTPPATTAAAPQTSQPNLPMIIGLLVVGFIAAFFFRNKN